MTPSNTISLAPARQAIGATSPEFFRLPSRGPDPYFGLTRPFYYSAEQKGYFQLVRIRDRGKQRGVTLVPYDAVSSFLRKTAAKQVGCAEKEGS